ncbi:MAG: RidA family protein [Acidimicrobiia bacterium]|nr:RidA family protein [Acidimicrobiia bacterium]
MTIVEHHDRGYGHVPGISPYSAGVRALAGHRIRRVALRQPISWRRGFDLIDRALAAAGRPVTALCSIELRCPAPHSFGGFGSFNDEYRDALDDRAILLDDGENPISRTNVAPIADSRVDTSIAAFGYTVPHATAARPSFIVSGAGDLADQSDLRPEAIVGGSASWDETGPARATAVLDELEARLAAMGLTWDDTDAVAVYSVEAVDGVCRTVVLDRLGPAGGRGLHRFFARPPIEGLRFEMDARGGVEELMSET